MATKILAILPDLIPSTVLNVIKPCLRLQEQGEICFKATLSSFCRPSQVKWADVILFCRNIEPAELRWLYLAEECGKCIIYDLDDNFFEMTEDTELGRYLRDPLRIQTLTEFLGRASLVRVYSEPLYTEASKYNKHVSLVNSYFDYSLLTGEKRLDEKKKLRITYATSRGENDMLYQLIAAEIGEIAIKYHNEVEFHIFGAQLPIVSDNVFYYPFDYDYNRFITTFSQAGLDIGLAPLKDDIFHRSKTNNKYREYGACGVAGIYSNVSVYSQSVIEGVNGILVGDQPGAWYQAMEKLINEEELRWAIKSNAYEDVRVNYSFEKYVETFLKDILASRKIESHRDVMIHSSCGIKITDENVGRILPLKRFFWLLGKIKKISYEKLLRKGELVLKLLKINYLRKY